MKTESSIACGWLWEYGHARSNSCWKFCCDEQQAPSCSPSRLNKETTERDKAETASLAEFKAGKIMDVYWIVSSKSDELAWGHMHHSPVSS